MDLANFDYYLPPELIAQTPAEPRDQARLMVVDRQTGFRQGAIFSQLPDFLQIGDVLLINNSKVLPARLLGHKVGSGGRIEILLEQKLSQPNNGEYWRCLVGGTRPGIGLVVDLASYKSEDLSEGRDYYDITANIENSTGCWVYGSYKAQVELVKK